MVPSSRGHLRAGRPLALLSQGILIHCGLLLIVLWEYEFLIEKLREVMEHLRNSRVNVALNGCMNIFIDRFKYSLMNFFNFQFRTALTIIFLIAFYNPLLLK